MSFVRRAIPGKPVPTGASFMEKRSVNIGNLLHRTRSIFAPPIKNAKYNHLVQPMDLSSWVTETVTVQM